MSEYASFVHGLAQQWERNRNEIWHTGSLGDEDDAADAQTSNWCANFKYTLSTEKVRDTTSDEKRIATCDVHFSDGG